MPQINKLGNISSTKSSSIYGLRSKTKYKQTLIQASLPNKNHIMRNNNFIIFNNSFQSRLLSVPETRFLQIEGTYNTLIKDSNVPKVNLRRIFSFTHNSSNCFVSYIDAFTICIILKACISSLLLQKCLKTLILQIHSALFASGLPL